MPDNLDFPRSPLRDYDPFGQKTGANPFAEPHVAQNATEGAETDNVFAASSALADPAPQVEYDAVLEPRVIVVTSTTALGLCFAVISTGLLVFFPPEGKVSTHALLFPIGMALFLGGMLTAQFDLRAMRQGAMKRASMELVRRLWWGASLGVVYCFVLEVFCWWPVIDALWRQAFG